MLRRALLFVLGISLWGPTPALSGEAPGEAEAESSFDYLYIVANEGGSSGGHTAIRFGRDVYHFQNEDGLLVLQRDRADDFLHAYTLLGNRDVYSTRVAVSEETRRRLLDHFRRRHRAQEAQIDVDQALQSDRQWLERLLETSGSNASNEASVSGDRIPISVPGLGYFASGGFERDPEVRTLLSLKATILEVYGDDFLTKRRDDLYAAVRLLETRDPTDWPIEPPASAYTHPPFAQPYARRWRDLAAGLAALDLLENPRPLAKAHHHAPRDAEFALRPEESRALERTEAGLTSRLVELADSRRPDWGQSLLIGVARLLALSRSIETGYLVFLDTFPATARRVDASKLDPDGDLATHLLRENQRQFEAARAFLRGNEEVGELAWERIEERSNRYLEILRAIHGDGEMRVARGHLVPSTEAPYPVDAPVARSDRDPSRDLDRARQRERMYARELHRLHRYDLIEQNCATALFETINDSFGGSAERSEALLGGYVSNRHSLAFIPFVSAHQVESRYAVLETELIPSYRRRRVDEMKAQESSLGVALRESNTFTAHAYERSDADSFFVFFTDGTPLLRPIFGAVNLTAAVGQSLVGVVTSPFDRGSNLVLGLRGTFVSLPELVFVNIRKGTYDWIPEAYRSLDPIQIESTLEH
jgi:hypothetical protein